jgi:hypothetical protein
MAKPRIFVSSTYYDLRHIRTDLETFIRNQGYDSVLNERGNIPYGKDLGLENYCYKEISNVDILVSIIGGRYGSESKREDGSISQVELKTAFDLNKQVYIFIDKGVYSEYKFYSKNKDVEGIQYGNVDNIKIYQFIEYVEGLPNNNTIHSFENSIDITKFLKEQWAGLFQTFLQNQNRDKEVNIIKGIEQTAKTLNQLVTFLTEEKKDSVNAINHILLSNHPAMYQIKELLDIPYKVFFTNKEEFLNILKGHGYREYKDDNPFDDFAKFFRETTGGRNIITYKLEIFTNDDKLKVLTKEEWKTSFITIEKINYDEQDDLPF